MSKGMKIFLWILVILAAIAVISFFWAKSVFDKVNFSAPKLHSLYLQGLTLNDLLKIALEGSQKEVKVSLGMDISNANNFSIPFSNMNVKMYYAGSIIAETSPALQNQKFILPANGSLSVTDNISIVLNAEGVKMLIEKIKGGQPKINYKIGLKVFGIPLPSIQNSFTW